MKNLHPLLRQNRRRHLLEAARQVRQDHLVLYVELEGSQLAPVLPEQVVLLQDPRAAPACPGMEI